MQSIVSRDYLMCLTTKNVFMVYSLSVQGVGKRCPYSFSLWGLRGAV